MEIQKRTVDFLKKVLWTDKVTNDQLFATRQVATAIEKNVDVESAWASYETNVAGTKLSILKKRKFFDLFRELSKPENRDIVHYSTAVAFKAESVIS